MGGDEVVDRVMVSDHGERDSEGWPSAVSAIPADRVYLGRWDSTLAAAGKRAGGQG